MSLPTPEPGLVIPYAYLWRHEHGRGQEEGRKIRPSVIVLAVRKDLNGTTRVTVAPITHTPPGADQPAIEMPPRVKQALGLDYGRSWVILAEVNQFNWPGYDVRPVPGTTDRFSYGFIPPSLHRLIVEGILDGARKRQLGSISRD